MYISITLDCKDPERLAEFWSEALGYHKRELREPYLVLVPQEGNDAPSL